MQPANVDMSVIREAMMRRAQGGSMPAGAQMTSPMGPSAQGGMPTPVPTAPNAQPTGQNITPRQGQSKMPAQVDDETRAMSKALVQKLIQYL